MNSEKEEISWDVFKTKIKEKYPRLTEADLQYNHGMEENMLRMVEYKLRMTKEDMRKIIECMNCFIKKS
jgi:hypothetical protein